MVLKLNIDEQIQNEAEITIAGQNRTVAFNDEFREAAIETLTQIDEILKDVDELMKEDKDGNSKFNDLSVDEQKNKYNGMMGQMRDCAIAFFDRYLGEGSGQQIFEHYHSDTMAIMKAIGILRDQADELLETDNRETRRAKEKEYTKNGKAKSKR